LFLVLGQSSLTIIEDFSPINTPSGQSRRFYISNTNNNNNNKQNLLSNNSKRTSLTSSISSTSTQLTTRLKAIIEGSEHTKYRFHFFYKIKTLFIFKDKTINHHQLLLV
jgi:hypothetical protein